MGWEGGCMHDAHILKLRCVFLCVCVCGFFFLGGGGGGGLMSSVCLHRFSVGC